MATDSGFVFGTRSVNNLNGVHPLLVDVMADALGRSTVDFIITEGVRSVERQRELFNAKKSQTMNSKHLKQSDGFSHAVDVAALVNGVVSWDWKYYEAINKAVQAAAASLGATIVWGGSWKTLKDGPHFQIEGV